MNGSLNHIRELSESGRIDLEKDERDANQSDYTSPEGAFLFRSHIDISLSLCARTPAGCLPGSPFSFISSRVEPDCRAH